MKIRMLKNDRRSPDKRQLLHYESGETYDVPKELGEAMIAEKVAELVPEDKKAVRVAR